MQVSKIVIILLGLLLTQIAAANESFPGRKKYPDVKLYEMMQLNNDLNKVIVIDARSKLEYETLRITNAVNIPVSSKTFEEQVKAIRSKSTKPIVFYCNGHTCFKSYIAARKAHRAKVKGVYAYDAGLFSWAQTYPNKSQLLGKSLVNKNQIIPTKEFKKRLLTPDAFSNLASKMGDKSIILDVRDKYQRGAAGFFPGQEKWVSLDDKEKLNKILSRAAKENKSLFIYDEVGKQVRWLQYALDQASIKNYYFMKKGAKGYYGQMMKEFGIKSTNM